MGCTAAENFFAPGLSPVDHLPWAENPALKQAVQPQCTEAPVEQTAHAHAERGPRLHGPRPPKGTTVPACDCRGGSLACWPDDCITAFHTGWSRLIGRLVVVAIDYIDSWVAALIPMNASRWSPIQTYLCKGTSSFVMAKSCKPYRVCKIDRERLIG